MELDVLPTNPNDDVPWYAGGLKFTCTLCGNCCTGGPGYVWVTEEEIRRAAEHLGISRQEMTRKYLRKVMGRTSFKERRQPNGEYDCIFLTDIPAATEAAGGGKELAAGEAVPVRRRGCSIYPVRPLQCRTWPFWKENIRSRKSWERTGRTCPGVDAGSRLFPKERVEQIRDSTDWPADPPTSAKKPC